MKKFLFAFASTLVGAVGYAQTIDSYYSANYSFSDLGSISGVVTPYGGLTLLAGNPNKLLIGGSANNSAGQIFEVDVTRDVNGHINGFSGSASVYATAQYNDGGLTYGPGGVLWASQWPVNKLAEYKPGSTTPDKIIDMGALGEATSHSALMFAPAGRSYSGRLKVASYNTGDFYDAAYSPDGSGTYDITSLTHTNTLVGNPEGFVYVPLGSTLFGDSMLVSEYGAGNVASYDVDANGDPIVSSRRNFITGLSGAEGAFIDPQTGDFLFSTFGGGNHVIVVQGFAPVPEPASLAVLGFGALALLRRRKK